MPLTNSFDSPTKEKRTSIESLAEDMKLSSDLKLNEGVSECAINVKEKNNTLADLGIKSHPENSSEKEQTLETSTLPVMECSVINTEQIDSCKATNCSIYKESKSVAEDGSTKHIENDSTEHIEDNSTKCTEDGSTKSKEDCTSKLIENDSTKHIEDGSTKHTEVGSTKHIEDGSTKHTEVGSTKHTEVGSTKPIDDRSTKPTLDCTSKPIEDGSTIAESSRFKDYSTSSDNDVKPEENNENQGHEVMTDNVINPIITVRVSSPEENQAEINKPKDISDNVTNLRTTEQTQSEEEEDMCIDNTSPPIVSSPFHKISSQIGPSQIGPKSNRPQNESQIGPKK
jgi:hypothetical protein